MIKKTVKVFSPEHCGYEYLKQTYGDQNISIFDIEDMVNKPINKKGLVDNKFKPIDKDIEVKTKYELDVQEKQTMDMMKHTMKQAEDLYESTKRKFNRYMNLLFIKEFPNRDIYFGDAWDCPLSPINRCVYEGDECIFCGNPEERK